MALTARKIRFKRGLLLARHSRVAVRDIDGTDSRSAVGRPPRGLICRSRYSPVPVFFQFSDAGSVTVAISSLSTKNCVKM